ncbi:MAG: nucleotidyltransferase family protein [Bacteroidales bacterium]|nr:nucleotidyltransferase family protein [Bacteroidales bacterium]
MDKEKADKIYSIQISINATMLDALKQMDKTFRRLLLVMNDDKFINILSIGDIQRAIIRNKPMNIGISEILREKTLISGKKDDSEKIRQEMLEKRIECMPVVDENGALHDVVFWEDVFEDTPQPVVKKFNAPVVIMAGGEGTRLRPITYVLPKALIPLGEKSMLENIIDSFSVYGCNDFYISVNHKAEMIVNYVDQVAKGKFSVKYIKENMPMGTAGSLYDLKNKINSTFFVSNCDILIRNDYSSILDYHNENKNELTIVAALKHLSIPYGIIETGDNGVLSHIVEKPEYTFQINSGMYILEPSVLDEIPKDKFFHMTDLIDILKSKNKKVGVFPVSEKSWVDIGNWNEYLSLSFK